VVERTILAPTPEDVVAVRREAFERVVASGAAPELVEVTVDVDARRNSVRATASGATAAAAHATQTRDASSAERHAAAVRALRALPGALAAEPECTAGDFAVFVARAREKSDVCIVDRRAVVRLVVPRAVVARATVATLERALDELLDAATAFGDVGRALPAIVLAYSSRVADLGAPAEAAHVVALAREEVRGLDAHTPVVICAGKRDA
jgi:hypothetical protein